MRALFFSAYDGANGFELWKSDGTEAGTALVKDIRPSSGTLSPSYLTDVNGTLFFTANDGTNGVELWALIVGEPTAITLASLTARPSRGAFLTWPWLGLAGLLALAMGGALWARRRLG